MSKLVCNDFLLPGAEMEKQLGRSLASPSWPYRVSASEHLSFPDVASSQE